MAAASFSSRSTLCVSGDAVKRRPSKSSRATPSCTRLIGESQLQDIFFSGLKIVRMGGGGEVIRFVCGFTGPPPYRSAPKLETLTALLLPEHTATPVCGRAIT
jgi:hypothetical protein